MVNLKTCRKYRLKSKSNVDELDNSFKTHEDRNQRTLYWSNMVHVPVSAEWTFTVSNNKYAVDACKPAVEKLSRTLKIGCLIFK